MDLHAEELSTYSFGTCQNA